MRHAGNSFESFKDPITIAQAARLTVKGSRFVPWKPSPGPTAEPAAVQNRSEATHLRSPRIPLTSGAAVQVHRARKGSV
jgi:hypothetical protein